MSVAEYLRTVPLPRMIRVGQRFSGNMIKDISGAIHEALQNPAISRRVTPGMRIALCVGSRGMDKLVPMVAATVAWLRSQGAEPFIVPAMGSHGGATAEGQVRMLDSLGITEGSAGCPIISSMETVTLGALENGLPVLMDANAMQADGIILLNRVKPHTGFSGVIESGIAKMLSIGLGKHLGAASCHAMGYGRMGENVIAMAKMKMEKTPFLFGIASVENAYDKVAKIAVLTAPGLIEEEAALLREAKANMPGILFTPLDVLVVDMMGKEYSGLGTDPGITGRSNSPYMHTTQTTARMVILDLSEKSKGNAAGLGVADLITRRLYGKIDLEATYINHLTATGLSGGRIPMIMDTDRQAVQAAFKTCNVVEEAAIRAVRIRNTLHLDEIYISESLRGEAEQNPNISFLGEPEEWPFDSSGNLPHPGRW